MYRGEIIQDFYHAAPKDQTSRQDRHAQPAHKLSRTRQEGETAPETGTLTTATPSVLLGPAYFSAGRLRELASQGKSLFESAAFFNSI